jgi:hypothetical protein
MISSNILKKLISDIFSFVLLYQSASNCYEDQTVWNRDSMSDMIDTMHLSL